MNKIIIYGAGQKGRSLYNFLKFYGKDECVIGFCDKNAQNIGEIDNKPVMIFDEAVSKTKYFLIGVGKELFQEVNSFLADKNLIVYNDMQHFFTEFLGKNITEFEHDYCAYFHVKSMDEYFERAEKDDWIAVFWKDSIFLEYFSRLDLKNVVELACGRGRHVPQYVQKAGHITLVDILEKNIDICKERFKNYTNISYYKNNGSDLKDLPDNSYTSLFTYDAMVHFELLDVAKYLNETYRILVPGGMALFHHSNNHSNYKASFSTSIGGRSFMSKKIFAHLAYRAGLEIVKQKVIDWGEPELDCITLVRKNGSSPVSVGENLVSTVSQAA